MAPSRINSNASPTRTTIVLVHGIGANRLIMWPLASRLRHAGFVVANWGYRSLWTDIRSHGRRLAQRLSELDSDVTVDSICVVAHSMGSIVCRSALAELGDAAPAKLRSAVLLTPPNTGSPVADFFSKSLSRISMPAIQLTTSSDSYVNTLPDKLGIPFGVIAARRDWVVPLPHTTLAAQADHTIVPGVHSMIVMRKDVVVLIRNFIEHQTFNAPQVES